jgi:hypothetical protein
MMVAGGRLHARTSQCSDFLTAHVVSLYCDMLASLNSVAEQRQRIGRGLQSAELQRADGRAS